MNAESSADRIPTRLSWAAVQNSFAEESATHLVRAQELGLNCPEDVFEQLFHDHHGDDRLAEVVRFVDWRAVTWKEGELSCVALRRIGVPRPFERALDEARWRTTEEGFHDERPDVMVHWMQAHTWIRSPILLTGKVLQSLVEYELLVGFTRLGNLLGAQAMTGSSLDRIACSNAAAPSTLDGQWRGSLRAEVRYTYSSVPL